MVLSDDQINKSLQYYNLYEQGLSVEQIAKLYDRKVSFVKKQISNHPLNQGIKKAEKHYKKQH